MNWASFHVNAQLQYLVFACLSWKTSSSHSIHRIFSKPAFQWIVMGWHFSFHRGHSRRNCSLGTFSVPLKNQSLVPFQVWTGHLLPFSVLLVVASLPPYVLLSSIKPTWCSQFPLSLSEIVTLKFLSISEFYVCLLVCFEDKVTMLASLSSN